MKEIKNLIVKAALIFFLILLLTACGNRIEKDNVKPVVNADNTNSEIKSAENFIKGYYDKVNNGDIKSAMELWYQSEYSIENEHMLEKYPYHFKTIRFADIRLSLDKNYPVTDMQNDDKYSMYTFTMDYKVTFDAGKLYFLNNGTNHDRIYLIKEKGNSNATWKIYEIEYAGVKNSTEITQKYYDYIKKSDTNSAAALWCTESPYADEGVKDMKKTANNMEESMMEDMYIGIYPHPFELNVNKDIYESAALQVIYNDIASKKADIPYSGRTSDYIYLVKKKNDTTDKWRIWKVEHRKNAEAAERIKQFYMYVDKGMKEEALEMLSHTDEKIGDANYEYIKNCIIDRMESVKISDIVEYSGEPDFYIDGYSFYRFVLSGEIEYKKPLEWYEKDGKFIQFVYMVMKNDDTNWYIYSIGGI